MPYNFFMEDLISYHFIDEAIEVLFFSPPVYEKSPTCPDNFRWHGELFEIKEHLAEWSDFTRRGRAARNMQPGHMAVAAGRGSLGVGRFFFRISTQTGRIFEIYYDRAPKNALHRKGSWYLYRELGPRETNVT